MSGGRRLAVLKDCLRRSGRTALLLVLALGTELVVFLLYGILLEPLVYGALLVLFLAAVFFAADYARALSRAEARQQLMASIENEWTALLSPEAAPENLTEADYQAMLTAFGRYAEAAGMEYSQNRQDMLDYYTAWVHQIKTPIAVMKLKLAGGEPERRALSAELFRIEQYVDMVLAYQRLGSGSNDLVIREYPLDELIRETVRKYAPQFVAKRLRLTYEGTEVRIVTDQKWYQCILEQLVSNAVKYTPEGGAITITAAEDGSVQLRDSGIGIAAEDLPRIFEKGYTGLNGRLGEKSSGLGLYLCGRAAKLLKLRLQVESSPGAGSCFTVSPEQRPGASVLPAAAAADPV